MQKPRRQGRNGSSKNRNWLLICKKKRTISKKKKKGLNKIEEKKQQYSLWIYQMASIVIYNRLSRTEELSICVLTGVI